MKPIRLLISATTALTTLLICTASLAQYQWIDANGRKVFSDQAPPASVPAKKIVQQPGKVAATAASSTEADATGNPKTDGAPATAPVAKPKAIDKELEAKKKQADDELAAKKKADQEAQTKAKIENCARAKSAKAGLDSGLRINQINAKGEREVMDDATRTAETKRVQAIIESDCK